MRQIAARPVYAHHLANQNIYHIYLVPPTAARRWHALAKGAAGAWFAWYLLSVRAVCGVLCISSPGRLIAGRESATGISGASRSKIPNEKRKTRASWVQPERLGLPGSNLLLDLSQGLLELGKESE